MGEMKWEMRYESAFLSNFEGRKEAILNALNDCILYDMSSRASIRIGLVWIGPRLKTIYYRRKVFFSGDNFLSIMTWF